MVKTPSKKAISNLRPLTSISKEEAKAIRQLGNKAMHKKRKEKKTFRKILEVLLTMKPTKKMLDQFVEMYPEIKLEGIDNETLVNLAQVLKAQNGDSKAYELIRDTIGQKPVDKQETTIKELPKIQFEIIE